MCVRFLCHFLFQLLVCNLTELSGVPSKGRECGYLLYYCSLDVKKSNVMKAYLADAKEHTEISVGTFWLRQCAQQLRSVGAFLKKLIF